MISPTIYMKDNIMISNGRRVEVEIAMTYHKENQSVIEYSFVNNINTYDGGTHLQGFRTALTRTINDVSEKWI